MAQHNSASYKKCGDFRWVCGHQDLGAIVFLRGWGVVEFTRKVEGGRFTRGDADTVFCCFFGKIVNYLLFSDFWRFDLRVFFGFLPPFFSPARFSRVYNTPPPRFGPATFRARPPGSACSLERLLLCAAAVN